MQHVNILTVNFLCNIIITKIFNHGNFNFNIVRFVAVSDATYTWSGTLPLRTQNPFGYSSKVFLGGVPWDITESILISTFKQFGPIKIEWPGKNQTSSQPKGYVYIVFESEKQV